MWRWRRDPDLEARDSGVKTVALSRGRWRWATRRAAGVMPLCFPPLDRETAPLVELAGADLLYVNLDGGAGGPAWYGDGGLVALGADQLEGLELGGVIAFVTACYGLGEDGAAGPMVAALRGAGCSAVVAGGGANWGGSEKARGVDLLGYWFRRGLELGLPAEWALRASKARLALLIKAGVPELDARGFGLVGDGGARAGQRRRATPPLGGSG